MEWYLYIADFFAGAFLANTVPHFVHGISGNKFPTPFADPPGKGLSSSTVNVMWGLFNLLIGYILLKVGHVNSNNSFSLMLFFAGVIVISIQLSIHFRHKEDR
ncbi:MAG TPA: hypothetical protein VE868_08305 [Balneolaceae bacterium]|nr:hypothetical protein [Balneolaceae bacterium]